MIPGISVKGPSNPDWFALVLRRVQTSGFETKSIQRKFVWKTFGSRHKLRRLTLVRSVCVAVAEKE
jgi:hypothetical protein